MAEKDAKPNLSKNAPWANRFAWALLVVTFSMICVGALATSYSAEMAVPDWPTIFGHNPLLYPVGDSLEVQDVLLVHVYRLLGFLAGGLALVLTVLLWKSSMRRLALAVFLGYGVQEAFSGLRVLHDEILLANLRDCAAGLFIALVAAAAITTSARWRRATPTDLKNTDPRLRGWTGGALVVVYVQIILGAQLRHLPVDVPVAWFGLLVWAHLIVAAVVLGLAVALFVLTGRRHGGQPGLHCRAGLLLGLVLAQVILGATGWIARFGWPIWFVNLFGRPDYTVVAEGRLQILATTSHVAFGVLCLMAALSLALWSREPVESVNADNPDA